MDRGALSLRVTAFFTFSHDETIFSKYANCRTVPLDGATIVATVDKSLEIFLKFNGRFYAMYE